MDKKLLQSDMKSMSLHFVLFFIMIMSMFFLTNFQPIFAENHTINVSNSEKNSYRVQLFSDSDNSFLAWTEDVLGNTDTFFAKSMGGDLKFSNPVNLSNNTGNSAFPRVVAFGEYVYVTWYDYTPCKSDIYFSKSSDFGETFETINLSGTPGVSYNPWIGVSGDNVFVVWNDSTQSDGTIPLGETECQDGYDATTRMGIFLAKSADNGETFETTKISNESFSWNPRMLVNKNNIFVVWNTLSNIGGEILFSKSGDYGNTFSDPIDVSNFVGDSFNAGIGVSENNVHVVWNQKNENSTDIFYTKSNDGGDSFSSVINLSSSSGSSEITRDTQIAASENVVYVVWKDNTNGEYDVFFTKSFDEGNSFSEPINLSQSDKESNFPQVVNYKDNVYVMWSDYSVGNGDILLRASSDKGSTFGDIENLSNDDEESILFILGPQIFSTENKVFAVWENMNLDEGGDLFWTSFNQIESSKEENLVFGLIIVIPIIIGIVVFLRYKKKILR